MKYLACLLILLITTPAFAMKDITVNTGYGYMKDSDNNIICKSILTKGKHKIDDDETYVELVDKDAFDSFVLPIQVIAVDGNEVMINQKIREINRIAAIEALKATGELPPNYKDGQQ